MSEIDYVKLLENVTKMINLLEFDAMRSPGKAKMNSQHLHSLYELKDRYDVMLAPAKKPVAKKPAASK